MKMHSNIYTITVVIAIILLSILLIIINYNTGKKNENNNMKTKMTTNEASHLIKDTIYIEGKKETIEVVSYNTNLGFTLRYEPEYFKLGSDNKVIKVTNIDDKNIYVLMEILTEEEYDKENFKMLSLADHRTEIIDGYLHTYKLIKDDNFYLKITKSIKNMYEYEGMDVRLDYIINTLYNE